MEVEVIAESGDAEVQAWRLLPVRAVNFPFSIFHFHALHARQVQRETSTCFTRQ